MFPDNELDSIRTKITSCISGCEKGFHTRSNTHTSRIFEWGKAYCYSNRDQTATPIFSDFFLDIYFLSYIFFSIILETRLRIAPFRWLLSLQHGAKKLDQNDMI